MFRFSGHIALIVLAAASLTACDSATELVEEPVLTATEEVPLEDQIVGLWERDIAQTTVGWLFKEGGVFQVGEPRPFFPVVGNWSLQGDTLQVTDPSCLDRGFYVVSIDEDGLEAATLDDSCDGRKLTLEGTWYRFVYGQ